MLQMKAIGSIGDIQPANDEGTLFKSTLMTWNTTNQNGMQTQTPEYWHINITQNAVSNLIDTKKGDCVEVSGFLKDTTSRPKAADGEPAPAPEQNYYSLTVLEANKIDKVDRKKMKVEISGKASVGDIVTRTNSYGTSLGTYEKYTPKNSTESQYKNTYWRASLVGDVKRIVPSIAKKDYIDIKKGIANLVQGSNGKTYCNLTVFQAYKSKAAIAADDPKTDQVSSAAGSKKKEETASKAKAANTKKTAKPKPAAPRR